MKYFLLIFLAACGAQQGASSGPAPASVAPQAAPRTTADPSVPVVTAAQPQDATAPSSPTQPSVSPYPNLFCYVSGGIVCTGGALGTQTITIDLNTMYTANAANETVVGYSVAAVDVIATRFADCSQPHGEGCYQHSVCIQAEVRLDDNFNSAQFCGNTVTEDGLLVDE